MEILPEILFQDSTSGLSMIGMPTSVIAVIQISMWLIGSLVILCGVWIALRPRLAAAISRQYAYWGGLALAILGLLVAGFGMTGFLYHEDQADGQTFDAIASAAYTTSQLFFLNSPIEELDLEPPQPTPDQAAASQSSTETASTDGGTTIQSNDKIARWYLSWAKVFATIFVFTIATQAIGALFHESYLKLQLRVVSGHIVVCGMGRIGRQLMGDLIRCRDPRSIVLIEPDPENRHLEWAREHGVLVVKGDATKSDSLHDARVTKASEIFIVTGSDESNIECVVELRDLLRTLPPRRRILKSLRKVRPGMRCRVHIMNRDLAEIIRERSTELGTREELLEIEVFNALERTARRLLEDLVLPMKNRPLLRPIKSDEVAHYVLLGFGDFGQTLALQLAELAHFENQQRLRLTILDQNIEKLAKPFLARYPRFAPEYGTCGPWEFCSDADAWNSQVLRPIPAARASEPKAIEYVCNAGFDELCEVTDEEFIRKLKLAFDPCESGTPGDSRSEPTIRPAILVCFEEDRKNFALAERLKNKLRIEGLDWPILVWIPRQRELSELLLEKLKTAQEPLSSTSGAPQTTVNAPNSSAKKVDRQPSELIPFGECNCSVAYEEITQSWSAWLASQLELSYQQCYDKSAVPIPEWKTREAAFHQLAIKGAIEPAVANSIKWDKLDEAAEHVWKNLLTEAFRASDRSAANHSVVKMAILNRRILGVNESGTLKPTELQVTPEQYQALLAMEHYRWVSERLLGGWRYHPNKGDRPRNPGKLHPELIPFSSLSESAQKKDQVSVDLLLGLCRSGKLLTQESTDEVDSRPILNQ